MPKIISVKPIQILFFRESSSDALVQEDEMRVL
jgi:hypothetical protein